jgi:hypothetical protein
MAKIKIEDLPKDYKITEEEIKRIKGGLLSSTLTSSPLTIRLSTSIGKEYNWEALSQSGDPHIT